MHIHEYCCFDVKLSVISSWIYMCLEIKVSSPLLHTLPVEVTVELCSLLCCLLYVLRNLTSLHLLRILLLHLLQQQQQEKNN